ncbi:MAG: diaminopimelate epimerase [Verrucomicrobiota bacterium]|jgi:diaminopimelate epimerase
MASLPFTKMHGCGNDFVVLDCLVAPPPLRDFLASKLLDRRFGIGGDQLVSIGPGDQNSDLSMTIHNADGSLVETCGNALRCVALWARKHGHAPQGAPLRIRTGAGVALAEIRGEQVRISMGAPSLSPEAIGLSVDGPLIKSRRAFTPDYAPEITCVSMGNPHCVIVVADTASAPVTTLGPVLERDPLFLRRTNVEFIQSLAPDRIRMRVWERGSGETLACGSGACAAAVAAQLLGLAGPSCTVELPGGELLIEWDGQSQSPVLMSGPGTFVFEGVWPL